jgi:hypothetical protein
VYLSLPRRGTSGRWNWNWNWNWEGFVKVDDKGVQTVGNFGQLPSMLREDMLLMELGTYSNVRVKDDQGQELRKKNGLEEFVLIQR